MQKMLSIIWKKALTGRRQNISLRDVGKLFM